MSKLGRGFLDAGQTGSDGAIALTARSLPASRATTQAFARQAQQQEPSLLSGITKHLGRRVEHDTKTGLTTISGEKSALEQRLRQRFAPASVVERPSSPTPLSPPRQIPAKDLTSTTTLNLWGNSPEYP